MTIWADNVPYTRVHKNARHEKYKMQTYCREEVKRLWRLGGKSGGNRGSEDGEEFRDRIVTRLGSKGPQTSN